MPPGRAIALRERRAPAPVPLRPARLELTAPAVDVVRSLARVSVATALNAVDPTVNPADHAAKTWPGDRAVPLLLRVAVSPTAVANAPALVALAEAFLAALAPQSAAADLLNRALSVRFDRSGRISVPGLGPANAEFVAEGRPIPVTQPPPVLGPTLTRHKIAAIVTATSEMLRSPAAENLIRAMLLESTGPSLDAALFSAAAASADRPAGLFNNITPLTSSGVLVDDLVALLSAIAPVTGNSQIAIVASPTGQRISVCVSRSPLRTRFSHRRA